MPVVKMPDGTEVEMPDRISPEQSEQLSRLIATQHAEATTPKAPEKPAAPAHGDVDKTAGINEAAMSMLTGAIAAPAGGLSGIGAAIAKAMGLTDAQPADVVKKVQESLTYQPRSETGKKIVDTVSAPFEKLAEGADAAGGKVADVTGSPAAGAAVNTAIQALPLVAGKLAPKLSAALSAREVEAAAARAKIASLQAPAVKGAEGARAAGYVLTPSSEGVNGGVVSRSVEGVSGEPKLVKLMAKKDAVVTNDLIRRDVGLPDDQPISRDALAAIRAEEGQKYEAIKKVGRINNDPEYFADLNDVTKSYDTAAKDFAHRSENPFQKTIDGLRVANFDAASAIEEVKLLRADADKAFANKDKGLGRAYRDMAQAVDDSIDRHLSRISASDPALETASADYRAARTRIAKTYMADKALNDSTGNIDALAYGRALKNKVPLDGAALQVAHFAQQFPRLAQRVEKIGSTGPTYADLLLAGVSKEALLLGARPAMRAAMTTNIAQRMMGSAPSVQRPVASSLAQIASDMQGKAATSLAEMGAMQRKDQP